MYIKPYWKLEGWSNHLVKYYFYGGSSQDVYLGCYGCSSVSSASICNSVGTYGSSVAMNSIWNSVGSYGSSVSSTSPWNSVAYSPPEIFNENKSVTYGKFTINTAISNRTTVTDFVNIINYFNFGKRFIDSS